MTILFILIACKKSGSGNVCSRQEYEQIQKRLAVGWNHWDTQNVLSQIHLPDGLSISIILKDEETGEYLKKALIFGENGEKLQLLAHAYDGSYSEMSLEWMKTKINIRTATNGDDLVMKITPMGNNHSKIIIQPEIVWGKTGSITRLVDNFTKQLPQEELAVFFPSKRTNIYLSGEPVFDSYSKENENCYVANGNRQVCVSTGKARTGEEIDLILGKQQDKLDTSKNVYGDFKDVYDAMQTILSWNTIYDPDNKRVITPVSRIWSKQRGGYVLFCWDNFFVAHMFAIDNKELAYANAIETIRIVDEVGFVPNHNGGNDISKDRSQPPVGSMVVMEIYDKYKEKWFLEEVYDRLLIWNRWWEKNRDWDGYLCWGSTPYQGMENSVYNASGKICAMWESGLDNSPMYDDVHFNTDRNLLALADVGLMGLYVMDCNKLAEIASILDRPEKEELRKRAEKYSAALQTLWSDEAGIFLNKNMETGEFSDRCSPTNFYPMLAKVATAEQVRRMMKEHLFNPTDFYGGYMIPSISRKDTGYADMDYWRGRIWGPLNYLVYMGMRNYDLSEERKILIDKSYALLMKEWLSRRYIFENYNADTGTGDDKPNSDNFYHWGALLGYIGMIEKYYE